MRDGRVLSAKEIAQLVDCEADDPDRLVVVPKPDTVEILERGGTSIDLRLGRWFMSSKQNRSAAINLAQIGDEPPAPKPREHFVRFGDAFTLHPGRFVLGATLEWIRLPANLSAQILGKSSLGRHGLIIETASGVHPGFSGCLTLELANIGEVPLKIFPGMEICQLFVHRVTPVPTTNLGTHSGQRKPALSETKEDALLRALSDGKE